MTVLGWLLTASVLRMDASLRELTHLDEYEDPNI